MEPKPAAPSLTSPRLWLQTSVPGRWPSWVPPSYADPDPPPALAHPHAREGTPHASPALRSSPWVVVNPVQPTSLEPFGHGELETERAKGQSGGDRLFSDHSPRPLEAEVHIRTPREPASGPGSAPCRGPRPRLPHPPSPALWVLRLRPVSDWIQTG